MTAPEPPVNVKLKMMDDSVIAVDTVYDGQSEDGIHMWVIVNAPPRQSVKQVYIDKLPAKTGVTFPSGHDTI